MVGGVLRNRETIKHGVVNHDISTTTPSKTLEITKRWRSSSFPCRRYIVIAACIFLVVFFTTMIRPLQDNTDGPKNREVKHLKTAKIAAVINVEQQEKKYHSVERANNDEITPIVVDDVEKGGGGREEEKEEQRENEEERQEGDISEDEDDDDDDDDTSEKGISNEDISDDDTFEEDNSNDNISKVYEDNEEEVHKVGNKEEDSKKEKEEGTKKRTKKEARKGSAKEEKKGTEKKAKKESEKEEKEGEETKKKENVWYIGPCSMEYAHHKEPAKGYLDDIDWYSFRDDKKDVEKYLLDCIDGLPLSSIDNEMLIEAAQHGSELVAEKLLKEYNIDPLYLPQRDLSQWMPLNAIQEAIRGGYANVVKVLTGSDNKMVIDSYNRTVVDYVQMVGSPIRPHCAKTILGLDLDTPKIQQSKTGIDHDEVLSNEETKSDSGWNSSTSSSYRKTCDIDVIYGDMSADVFFKEYFVTGRPFVLRGHASDEELKSFSKARFSSTEKYSIEAQFRVGPTAYPDITGQRPCERRMTIEELENATKCEEMPTLSMVHAHHPDMADLAKLYSMYDGNNMHRSGGWRKIREWFDFCDIALRWQIFFGGDSSGATLHWHEAAFNILYVGVKEWRLTPPLYRGLSGMPSRKVEKLLEREYTMACTQQPGDQMYIPDSWGHMTINHGFTIGAAAILTHNLNRQNVQIIKKDDDMTINHGFTIGAAAILPPDFKISNVQIIKKDDNIITPQPQDIQGKIIPFLFVHINKTGGTSLIRMFGERCKVEYKNEKWGNETKHRNFHATAHSYIEHFGRESWDNAYTFAVVRHPLARQVSNFFFLVNNCENKPDHCADERLIPKSFQGVSINDLSDDEKINAFHEWIMSIYSAYPPGSPEHYLFGSKGHGNEEFSSFNSTQTSWLVDDKGDFVVKSIFRLEELSKNMDILTHAIPCLENENEEHVEMEKSNVTPDYPDIEMFKSNEQTMRIIREVYAVDFKNFGYEL